jgi:DNA-binding Lrp family transcriptional regulator
MELDALGLPADEGRMYVVLVGRPRSTASELGDACGLSPAAAGRILARLVDQGLAGRIAGRPPRFLATTPDVAITSLINQRENELGRARSFVHQLMETHREVARITYPDMALDVITSRDDISAMALKIQDNARTQVRAFDRPPYVDRPGVNLALQIQRQRHGVAHRVIYDRASVAWPGRMQRDIMPSVRAGEKARVRPDLPLKLLLCDDEVGIIPFSLAPGGQSAAYVIHRSPLLVALVALFEAEWDRGVPLSGLVPPKSEPALGRAPSSAEVEPDEETRGLLTLLAAGLTDAAIARSLGWSARTTQRRIQRLMQVLGASTRFQASLAAARRGWL